MRRSRSNPKRGPESGIMFLWYRPAHFVFFFRRGSLGFKLLLWSWSSVIFHRHIVFAAPTAPGHRAPLLSQFQDLGTWPAKYALSSGSYIHGLCQKTHTKKAGKKEMAPDRCSVQTSQESVLPKIGICPATSWAARESARERPLVTNSLFQFENKYWMLWLRVVYNVVHDMR